MPNEIKVGEYIRAKSGEIAKIVDVNIFDKTIYKDVEGSRFFLDEIVKHSKNIIDLIEVGDYVNGLKVYAILKDVVEVITNTGSAMYISNNSIKSIVTKEQFKAVEYKVGD